MSTGGHGGNDDAHNRGEEKVTVPLDWNDNWWSRQKNSMNFMFDRLTKEDFDRYRKFEEYRRWPQMLPDCQKRRADLMKYSPVIRFLTDKIGQMGGRITINHWACNFCVDEKAGGFNPISGLELCANKLVSKAHQEEVMAHELVHVYDHLRFEVDWDDLRHSACSEIRASSLSGECRFLREFWKNGQYKINKGYQDCVRRKAMLSMQARHTVRDEEHARTIVDSVFDSCMTDTRPFDEVYK